MAPETNSNGGLPQPIIGMLLLGIGGMIVVSLSFIVIRYWPLPVSVAPYFGGRIGLIWGLVVGATMGLVIGYLTDDKHFTDSP